MCRQSSQVRISALRQKNIKSHVLHFFYINLILTLTSSLTGLVEHNLRLSWGTLNYATVPRSGTAVPRSGIGRLSRLALF